jgi:hypothetical protein
MGMSQTLLRPKRKSLLATVLIYTGTANTPATTDFDAMADWGAGPAGVFTRVGKSIYCTLPGNLTTLNTDLAPDAGASLDGSFVFAAAKFTGLMTLSLYTGPIVSVSIPGVSVINELNFDSVAMTTINVAGASQLASVGVGGAASLVTANFSGCAIIDPLIIQTILAKCNAAVPGVCNLSGGTNLAMASWNATSLARYAVLTGAGWSVPHN